MIDKPTRNHWIYMVQNILLNIKNMWFLIVLCLVSKHKITFIGGLLAFVIFSAIIKWYNTLFYLNDNMLVFKAGLFSKSKQEIPFDKINTVDIGQNLLYRVLNTCAVKIDSGSTALKGADFKIVVKYKLAEKLREDILNTKADYIENEEIKEENFESEVSKTITFKEILIYGLTKGKLGWAFGAYFAIQNFLGQIEEFIKTPFMKNLVNTVNIDSLELKSASIVILIVISVFILGYILITLLFVIVEYVRLYKFSIMVRNKNLNIRYGLISKKEYSFPIEKVHAIRVKQKILQQLLGVYTIEVVTIGYGDEKAEKAILYPIANKRFMDEFLGKLLPEMYFKGEIRKPPKSSFRRFIFKRTIIAVVILIPLYFVFKTVPSAFKIEVISIVILINGFLGYLNYKNTTIGVSEKTIRASSGSLTKTTTLIKQSSVQAISKAQNPFQRKGKVCDYKIDIYSNTFGEVVKVRHMDESIIESLNENLIV